MLLNKLKESRKLKKEVHSEIVKIYINGEKKIRDFDIVGYFSNLEGVVGNDIGIIEIQNGFSYVDILNGKGNMMSAFLNLNLF